MDRAITHNHFDEYGVVQCMTMGLLLVLVGHRMQQKQSRLEGTSSCNWTPSFYLSNSVYSDRRHLALRSRVTTTSRNQFHVSISFRSWLDYKLMQYSRSINSSSSCHKKTHWQRSPGRSWRDKTTRTFISQITRGDSNYYILSLIGRRRRWC